MADVETRRLLHEIDNDDVVQQYLKQACSDLYEIIHLMSMGTCSRAVNTYRRTQLPGTTGADRTYKYQKTMQFLMNLGTTQNRTHPGSVRRADVCSVFARGNTRERCALLMNMLCNDKRYCVMQWIFRRGRRSNVASGNSSQSVTQGVDSNGDYQDSQSSVWQTVPSCLNEFQIAMYQQTMSQFKSDAPHNNPPEIRAPSVCAKKDMRRALCKLLNCPRKNTRSARPLHEQQTYALAVEKAVPVLSEREKMLIYSTCAPNALFVVRKQLVSSGIRRSAAESYLLPTDSRTLLTAEEFHTQMSPLGADSRDTTQSHLVARSFIQLHSAAVNIIDYTGTQSRTGKPCMHQQTKTPTSALCRSDYEEVLPWQTGRMCWTMLRDSAFFLNASRHSCDVISGPSGHTHALLTLMRIFRNFDIRKWTLICLVWLVGADHHSIHEVLFTATRHGLVLASEGNTLQVTRALLRTVGSNSTKSACGPVAVVNCSTCGIGASF